MEIFIIVCNKKNPGKIKCSLSLFMDLYLQVTRSIVKAYISLDVGKQTYAKIISTGKTYMNGVFLL